MNLIMTFFDHPFFIVVGGIATILMLGGFLYAVWLVVTGALPVWYRLGIGLSKRKVSNSGDTYLFLKTLLLIFEK